MDIRTPHRARPLTEAARHLFLRNKGRLLGIAVATAAVLLLQALIAAATAEGWALVALLALFTALAIAAPWLRSARQVGVAVAALFIGTGMTFEGLISPTAEGPEVMGLALMVAFCHLLLIASSAVRLFAAGCRALRGSVEARASIAASTRG